MHLLEGIHRQRFRFGLEIERLAANHPAGARGAKQLERLEAIVRRLESEDLDLDEALKLFEEGVERLRVAREQLSQAELKVKKVLEIESPS